ncbi:MAG: hypothetical protein NUW06_00455 [Candidatus Acetothermia bacterium]|jgi:WD40 repeat protein|nr:hypothetical protein [Candidatus Acetothermia bacterium]MDH7504985.1 hypothetical protein [Candidatus Acetothermia bacterium]
MRRRVIFLGLLCALLTSATAAAQLTPPYDWQMMETPHFRIIFHPEVEGLACEAAVAAEDAYQLWAAELATTPPPKTDIVVIDFDDSPNGFADPYELHSWEFASQVQFSAWSGGRVASNIADTIYHEYWHIVDIGKVSGPSQVLRQLLGRKVIPNDLKPLFNIEGSATYGEYLKYGYSRANFATAAMYLRQMALDNDFPPLDRAATYFTNTRWPSLGTLWYLLGAWFMRYIEEEHGRGVLAKLDELNARSWSATLSALLADLLADQLGVAFYVGPDFGELMAQATGVSARELYEGFQQWLRSQALEHLREVEAEGITSSIRLTSHGYWTAQPRWSPDGQWIAYEHDDPFRLGGVRLVRPDGRDDHPLLPATFVLEGAFSWSPDGRRLVYSSYDRFGHYFSYNDLYLYDLEAGKAERLTRGARAYNPVFTPDGSSILFGKQGPGDRTSLMRLELATGAVETIKEFPPDTFLDFFALSPDGRRLALSIWKRPGFSDLYLMSATGGGLQPLTQDRNEDLRPTWSPDGEYVLFDSIRDETFNVYAVHISDRSFLRVTNAVSGASAPTISPDGKRIAFIGYSSRGYDLHLMDFDPTSWKAVSFPSESIPSWPGFPEVDYPVRPYDPSQTMRPKYWEPALYGTRLGARTSAWDALYRRSYFAEAGYDWSQRGPFASLSYTDSEQLSPLVLSLSLDLLPYGNAEQLSLEYWPLEGFYQSQRLSLAVERAESAKLAYSLSAAWDGFALLGKDLFWQELEASLGTSLYYDTETGEWSREAVLELRDYLHLPVIDLAGPHELALRLAAGWSDREGNFALGGTSGQFLLRGQPDGVLEGSLIAGTSIEYRFPLLSLEKGWGLRPLFLDDLRGALFADAGLAGDRLPTLAELKAGYGLELQLLFTTGFGVPQALSLGVAYGLGQPEPIFYLGFGSAF